MQHPAQRAGFLNRRRLGRIWLDQHKLCGKFTTAQVGLVHALALAGTASEHFGVLDEWIGAALGQLQFGMNAVGHIAQQQAGTLLAFVFHIQPQLAATRCHGLLHIARGDHSADLVAP